MATETEIDVPEITTGVLWDAVVKELDRAEIERDEEDDEPLQRVWLGSCMALAPSGKMYAPWATSNLDPCPGCKGTGAVPNRHGDETYFHALQAVEQRMRVWGKATYGLFAGGAWPQELRDAVTDLSNLAAGVRPVHTCERCGGCGSHEAFDDERFWELLDAEAEYHGCWVWCEDGEAFLCRRPPEPSEPLV